MSVVTFDIADYRALAGEELADLDDALDVRPSAVIQCGGKSGSVTIVAIRQGEALPANTVEAGPSGTIFISEDQYPWYLDLLRNESVNCSLDLSSPKFHRIATAREAVGEREAPPAAGPVPDLDDWLQDRPDIGAALIWDGHAYVDWDDALADRLADYFAAAWRRDSFGEISEPPENVAFDFTMTDWPRQVIDSDDAKILYLGYAAHCLALEIGGRLPWSIAGLSSSRLRMLLDSAEMFHPAFEGFEVDANLHGHATPASAGFVWRFLLENNLIDSTPLATVGRTLEWCRDNLSHFSGPVTTDNYEAHWHYRGFPPVARVVEGTTGPFGFEHWTAGCWGTSGFLKCVLRAANIPVRIALKPDGAPGQHALPTFPSIGRHMTHGDDPYNRLIRSGLPKCRGEELLITRTRFNQLFGPDVDSATQANNIGLRTLELALSLLPLELLRQYCDDQDAGLDHASGGVFGTLDRLGLSVQDLEAAGLWTRMDDKIGALGGCGNLPE